MIRRHFTFENAFLQSCPLGWRSRFSTVYFLSFYHLKDLRCTLISPLPLGPVRPCALVRSTPRATRYKKRPGIRSMVPLSSEGRIATLRGLLLASPAPSRLAKSDVGLFGLLEAAKAALLTLKLEIYIQSPLSTTGRCL